MTAVNKAGSLLTGWMRSCWSCLSPDEETQEAQNAPRAHDQGVKRDMQVCHTQPHLVPPMQLVVYDDLPSPRIHHTRNSLSLSSWLEEGRNLAERASNRASMTISRKRHTTTPLKISGPADFRRVQSFHQPSPLKYEPLELSIYRSGKRLSDLPSFESFQFQDGQQRQTLAIPPRALSTPKTTHRRCVSTASGFSVSRKPVGSGDNRRSLGNIEVPIDRRQPVRIPSSLIPHFSVVKPVQVNVTDTPLPIRSVSMYPVEDVTALWKESMLTLDTNVSTEHVHDVDSPRPVEPILRTPVTRDGSEKADTEEQQSPIESSWLKDSPSTCSSRTFPSRLSSLRRPSFTPTDNRKTIASVPLPSRLSDWFFPEKAKDTLPRQVSLTGEKGFEWERTRTLSDTTVASTITTVTAGTKSRNPNASISSSCTGASTLQMSLHRPSFSRDKEIETGVYHPTIYEGQPQRNTFHDDPVLLQEATIGVAF
ncbi:hypothetical protein N7456_009474 [Penicillium angulare]|uniref:Uncharacterized protein n=1 Tax=Penicillium angulare TaxID=116970 RepID=A0A9W9K574_9EURO|nr:hypothetical protein N7456_009474 [Penicillium angulare]